MQLWRGKMKAEDKPKYVAEARELLKLLDIERLINNPNDLVYISKINRLIAIFTNFSSNDGQELKRLFQEFQKWARRSTSTGTIRNRAIDMIQFIGQKIEEMDIYRIDPENNSESSQTKPAITATNHILPFQRLSPDDFVRLSFWILQRSFKYRNRKVEYYEGMGDKQRDIIAHTADNKKHYYQCKKYQQIAASTLKQELDLLKLHCDKNQDFKPEELTFIVGCKISPQARDEVNKHGASIGFGNITIWSEVELDERAKATDGVLEEFFGFNKDLVRSVVQEVLSSEGNKNTSKNHSDIPILDLEGLRRSGGPTGQFILLNITNLSQTQKAIDCQWELRGFDYSFRSPDNDRFSLQPNLSKEVTYRLDGEKPYQNEVNELSLVMEYKDMNGIPYFTRREIKQIKVPSGAFYEFERGGQFYPAEQMIDVGIVSISGSKLNGDKYESEFEVNFSGQRQIITIGISRTFLSVWGISQDKEKINSAIAELGSRVIRKMLLKKELNNHLFITDDFPQDYQNDFKGYQLLRNSL